MTAGVGRICRDHDDVFDVIARFEAVLSSGGTAAEATALVLMEHAQGLEDEHTAPFIRLALADMQWTYAGSVDPAVLRQVKSDVQADAFLDQGCEYTPRARARERERFVRFVDKLDVPNSRPRKPPRTLLRPPVFVPGDCLAVRLSNGQFAAAFMIVADDSDPEYGRNLIGVLDWLGDEPPSLDVFRERKYLHITHGNRDLLDVNEYPSKSFRAANARIEVVGRLAVLDTDPTITPMSYGWERLGEHVLLQRAWEARRLERG